jgi:oligoribonuclease
MEPMQDPKNLVWIDLEMTGLDPEHDTILEIATIVTDSQLTTLAEGPVHAIRHSKEQLDAMDPWCVDHHGSSGLTKRCLNSTVDIKQAEDETLAFVRKWCPEKSVPLCGNSVHQDRRFMVLYMPRLNDYLHYRIIDVSSVKEIVERWYPQGDMPPRKKQSHLALDDIRESIEELSNYRRLFFRKD